MADGTIDSLSIEIGASSTKAVQGIQTLTESLKGLKKAQSGNKSGKSDMLTKMKSMSSDAAESMSKIDLLRMKLTALRQEMGKKMAFGELDAKGIANAALQIKNDQAQIDNAVTKEMKAAQKARKFVPAFEGTKNSQQVPAGGQTGTGVLGVSKESSVLMSNFKDVGKELAGSIVPGLKTALSLVKKLASAVLNVAKGIAKWAFKTVLGGLKSVLNLMKNIGKAAINVAKKIPSLFAKMTKITGIQSLVNSVKGLQKAMSGFSRIAFYRAIRSAIKYVTDALKEGTENAYWYSKEFGNATRYISEAYDQMSSANFKMSNQLGAAWATLIAYIQPIIMQIISLVTKAAEVVTQFFAVLSGKGTYLKAVDYAKDWADATEDGNKAAKEWKNQLLGFDEINRLEEPSDNGSKKGKDKYTDYGNMFEEAPIEGCLADLKKLLESKEWANIGQLLGNTVNEWINSVDWAGLGKKFGEKIYAMVTMGYNFLKTMDFKNLGSKLAEFLNNAVEGIDDFEQLGRLAMRLSTSLWDIIYGAVVNVDWKQMAIKMSDFILGALNELSDWLSTLEPEKIAKAIKDFFGNIKYEEIKDTFISTIKLAWQKAIELKDAIFDDETKEKFKEGLKTFFSGINWEEITETLKLKLQELWGFITGALEEIFPEEQRQLVVEWIKEKIMEMIDKIDFAAIHNVLMYKIDAGIFGEGWANWYWSKGDYAGKDIIMGMINGLDEEKPAWEESLSTNVKEPVDTTFQSCKNTYEGYKAGYSQFTSEVDADNNTIAVSTSGMGNSVMTDLQNVVTETNETSNAFQDMTVSSERSMSTMENHVNSGSSRIQSALKAIKKAAKSAWAAIEGASDRAEANIEANGGLWTSNFASGGWPSEGEIFLARESGPEMVGTIGGRTAVANNNDIVAAIEGGVYNAMAAVMTATGGSRSGGGVSLNINGREFMRAIWDDRNAVIAEHGVSLVTNG